MTLSNVALKDAPEYRSKRENIYLLLVMVKYSLQKFIRELNLAEIAAMMVLVSSVSNAKGMQTSEVLPLV